MWLTRLTPRLSRRRANSVCGSWQSYALVQCTGDFCPAQEMVCDKLSRPKSDSERDAAVGDCVGFGQAPHVAISPLGWRCIQIVHVLDDVRFHWVPLRSDSGSGNVEVLKKRLHQDSVTQDVTVIHLAVVRQASVLLQRMPWVMSTGELFWPTKLGICRFLQSDRAVRMESLFLCRVGHAKPRKGARHGPQFSTLPSSRRGRARIWRIVKACDISVWQIWEIFRWSRITLVVERASRLMRNWPYKLAQIFGAKPIVVENFDFSGASCNLCGTFFLVE